MKIFVGNLSGQTTKEDLRQAFEGFGQVTSVTIVTDTDESTSQGFGFVIMPSEKEAQNAIKKMNGKDFKGNKISVEKSRTNAKARASRRKRGSSAKKGRVNGVRRRKKSSSRRGKRRR